MPEAPDSDSDPDDESDGLSELPDNTSRPRGCLTKRDREYLINGGGIEPSTQRERDVRGIIRERTWNALLDFALVYEHMQDRDRRNVFVGSDEENIGTQLARDHSLVATTALIYEAATRPALSWDEGERPTLGDEAVGEYEDVLKHALSYLAGRPAQGAFRLSDPEVSLSIRGPEDINAAEVQKKIVTMLNRTKTDNPEAATADDVPESMWQSLPIPELLMIYWFASTVEGTISPDKIGDVILIRLASGESDMSDQYMQNLANLHDQLEEAANNTDSLW